MDTSEGNAEKNGPFDYYRLFWKWHLYAGLFVSPVLIIVALTGAILVFPEAIERTLAPELWEVSTVGQKKISDAELTAVVASHCPNDTIFSYVRPHEANGTYLYWLIGDYAGFREVFVNPYTGEVVGERLRERSFVRVTEQLHRRLLTGKWGSMVVDLATGWMIVLLVTGLYLWWPKTWKRLKHGLTIRLRSNMKKLNWQLHNTVGFYSFVVLLLLCLTGMVVSEITGSMYRLAMVSTGAFPQSLIKPPKSDASAGTAPIAIDAAILSATQVLGNDLSLSVRLPRTDDGSYLIATKTDGSSLSKFNAVVVDQYNGVILEELPWVDSHLLMKIRSVSMAIHFGSIYGLPTKILALLGCLITPLLCLSGYLIWWWKRPGKKFSTVPKQDASRSIPGWLKVLILMFGLLFPAVGVTAVLCYAFSRLNFWFCQGRAG